MLFFDKSIDQLVQDKVSINRKLTVAAADIVFGQLSATIISIYERMEKAGQLNGRDITIAAISKTNPGCLVFNKTPKEVLLALEPIQHKKVGPVPSKVLQKMVASRFIEIHKIINHLNEMNVNSFQYAKISNPNLTAPQVHVAPVFETVSDVETWAKTPKANLNWAFNKVQNALIKKILSKPELTDQDVVEAQKLVEIHKIMTQ